MDLVKKIDKLIGNSSNVKGGATKGHSTGKRQIEWGFDLTNFGSPDAFKRVLRAIGASAKGHKKVEKGLSPVTNLPWTSAQWIWKGKNVTLTTGCNPITGQLYDGPPEHDRIGYASYMGLTGEESAVLRAVEVIKAEASGIKDESPYKRDFI